MTRLQNMFIQLSKYKTVEELEKATSPQFIDDLFAHLAFDDDGNVHTCGHFPDCNGCVIGCNKFNVSPRMLTVNYLNTEINSSRPQQYSIIFLRDKALDYLKKNFDIAKKNSANPLLTAIALDTQCDIFERIGLFEPNECHNMLLKLTQEKHK